jgi:outer membrane protein assembly factor BamA
VVSSQETDKATGEVSVAIQVSLGELHRIQQPKVASPDGRGVSETQEAAAPFVGQVANTANLNLMRAAVEEKFISQGFRDVKITANRSLDSPRYIPEFTIDLGKQVRLRNLQIAGLEKTNPKRVEERMRGLEGEWYDEAAVNKRLRGFLATGAFSSVRVTTEEVSENSIDATLHLQETEAREITAAAGIDSYQGFILRTTYADRNLMGELLGFSTGFEFSSRGVLGETRITDPWLFGYDVAATARVYAMIYGREGYQTFETGLDGKATWRFGDHYSLEVLAGYSFVETTEEGLPLGQLGETTYTHPRLRVLQKLDHRDSAVLATEGWHLENSLEIGTAIGDISIGYARTSLSGGWYKRLNEDYQLGLGGEMGAVVPSGDSRDLPIDLRLFNGGARSVRSFAERELGPTVEGFATGGEAAWNTNLELIRRLSGTFRAVAFVDAGSLAREYEDLTASEIEIAAGLGVRLDLPIGPVRLEYGYNLTQDGEEPVGALHFAIGAAF